jgi:hypothetical protein
MAVSDLVKQHPSSAAPVVGFVVRTAILVRSQAANWLPAPVMQRTCMAPPCRIHHLQAIS